MLSNTSYIGRAQSLGTLLANKLHCFAFIQRLVTALRDGGEMHKYILSAGALNEAESFGAIEPLHYTLFFDVHSPSLVRAQLIAVRVFAHGRAEKALKTPQAALAHRHSALAAAR